MSNSAGSTGAATPEPPARATGCPVTGDALAYPPRRACPFDPPPLFKSLRDEQPIARVRLWNGSTAWLITRYDDVRAILNHPSVSADSTLAGYPGASPSMYLVRKKYRSYVSMDPPEHTWRRRMVASEFTMKRVEALQPRIQEHVDGIIDGMLAKGPPIDVLDELLLPLPSLVICTMLGVPYEDHDFFQRCGKKLISERTTLEEATAITHELCETFIAGLIDKKDANPGDDLLSRVVVEHYRTGAITKHDLISLSRMLLQAGHETTANTMAIGLLVMLTHFDQYREFANDPVLATRAVDEILRYVDAGHSGRRRTATADFEFGGVQIRAGDGIIAQNNSANRDEAAFENPDTFDIHRDASRHVAFGYGVHQCQGQLLARAEMKIVYTSLLKRIPTLRLAVPIEEIRFKEEQFVYGVETIPVTW